MLLYMSDSTNTVETLFLLQKLEHTPADKDVTPEVLPLWEEGHS